jgi:hypothetical protein
LWALCSTSVALEDLAFSVRVVSLTNGPVGRPKSKWEDDVKNDLKKLKVVKWSDPVQDRH